jgi:hypothetical protein
MTTSCTDWNHPYYKELSKIGTRKALDFFKRSKNRMKNVSLGEALDFVSFGGMNFVVWELNKKGLISFIQNWMDAQEPSYFWNREGEIREEQLPFINYKNCPSHEKHTERVRDLAGRLRCGHIEIEKFKPNFIESYSLTDDFSGMKKKYFSEDAPNEPIFDDEDFDEQTGELNLLDQERLEEYNKKKEKFDNEEPSILVHDFCYSIISDEGIYLPLESVLTRLDVAYLDATNSFSQEKEICVYPFSGFTLANFIKAWAEQKGEKRFFLENGKKEHYRLFRGFQPISSDD